MTTKGSDMPTTPTDHIQVGLAYIHAQYDAADLADWHYGDYDAPL